MPRPSLGTKKCLYSSTSGDEGGCLIILAIGVSCFGSYGQAHRRLSLLFHPRYSFCSSIWFGLRTLEGHSTLVDGHITPELHVSSWQQMREGIFVHLLFHIYMSLPTGLDAAHRPSIIE